jgi:hypothetical protein
MRGPYSVQIWGPGSVLIDRRLIMAHRPYRAPAKKAAAKKSLVGRRTAKTATRGSIKRGAAKKQTAEG